MTRTKTGSSSQVPSGTVAEIDAQGKTVAVTNVSGEFYAIDGIYSHRGSHLGKGKLRITQ